MRRILRHRPSPALVVACLALTIALSGTGYAAVTLPRNSVGTPQLKRNAVNASKVKNFSLLRVDFKRGQIPAGPRGATGATGATGAAGAAGAAGAPGRSALSSLQSGETIRGTIGTQENNLTAGQEIATTASFPIPTTVALDDVHVSVNVHDEASGECTGTATNPTAAPGYVCIYPWFEANITTAQRGYIWGSDALAGEKWGFQISALAAANGSSAIFANWAYTAP